MKNYQAILFHPEGDFVTDFHNNNDVNDVWDKVSDMGSRWGFYPISFVGTNKIIIDTPEGLEFLKGKRIASVKKYLNTEWNLRKEEICDLINDGVPLGFVYS